MKKHQIPYHTSMKISLISFFIIISDIVSKYWAHIQMPNISLIGDWVKIVLFKNTGIAFSTPLNGIHIIVPLILWVLLGYIIISWKKLSEMEKMGYVLIFIGWTLNAIERSIFGSVTDMISVRHFAVFNIADISVSMGVIVLFIVSILSKKEDLNFCK